MNHWPRKKFLHSNSKFWSQLKTTMKGGFNFSQQCNKMHYCGCTIMLEHLTRKPDRSNQLPYERNSLEKISYVFSSAKEIADNIFRLLSDLEGGISLSLLLRFLIWISKCYQLNIGRILLLHFHEWCKTSRWVFSQSWATGWKSPVLQQITLPRESRMSCALTAAKLWPQKGLLSQESPGRPAAAHPTVSLNKEILASLWAAREKRLSW